MDEDASFLQVAAAYPRLVLFALVLGVIILCFMDRNKSEKDQVTATGMAEILLFGGLYWAGAFLAGSLALVPLVVVWTMLRKVF